MRSRVQGIFYSVARVGDASKLGCQLIRDRRRTKFSIMPTVRGLVKVFGLTARTRTLSARVGEVLEPERGAPEVRAANQLDETRRTTWSGLHS